MTRKDYIIIARALNSKYEDAGSDLARLIIHQTAWKIADALQEDNPRFNHEHFLAVVLGDKALESRPPRQAQAS